MKQRGERSCKWQVEDIRSDNLLYEEHMLACIGYFVGILRGQSDDSLAVGRKCRITVSVQRYFGLQRCNVRDLRLCAPWVTRNMC